MTKTITKTIDYCIKFGISFLKNSDKIDTDNINTDTKILLAHILQININDIFLMLNKVIPDVIFNKFKRLLKIRYNGKPVYKIIGEKPFFKKKFITNKNVLDPRSDTEILVESVVSKYKNKRKHINFLEFGVGSGCVILSILSEIKNSTGYGIDISKSAINTANQNAIKLKLDKKINFIVEDWNNLNTYDFKINKAFDCIISNPPYIKTSDIKMLSTEVKSFDPKIALDGGKDGLKCYKEIANSIKNQNIKLNKNAKIFLEIGNNQFKDVKEIFTSYNFKFIEAKKDLNNIIRVLVFSV